MRIKSWLNKKVSRSDIIFVVILIIIFTQVLSMSRVVSGSMSPTLKEHDITVGFRLAYKFEKPKRGDIIEIKDTPFRSIGKRVIGTEGDLIEFYNGNVYVNEVQISEPYLEKGTITLSRRSFRVPKNCVFVMGDNRMFSKDSRLWKKPYINIKRIKSKTIFIIPLSRMI